jgi:hypothetical protein
VNATVSTEIGRQLHVLQLPPSLHTAACNNYLKTLPSGRRHFKLELFNAASLLAAAAVLPQMQGLVSLQLAVHHDKDLGCDFQNCSFLSRKTTLKEIKLNVQGTGLATVLLHLNALNALKHLNLCLCGCVTDSVVAHLRGLTALQQLNLSRCRSVKDNGVSHLSGLTALQRLGLIAIGCNSVTDCGVAHLKGLTALQQLYLSEATRDWCCGSIDGGGWERNGQGGNGCME